MNLLRSDSTLELRSRKLRLPSELVVAKTGKEFEINKEAECLDSFLMLQEFIERRGSHI